MGEKKIEKKKKRRILNKVINLFLVYVKMLIKFYFSLIIYIVSFKIFFFYIMSLK